MTLTAGQEKAFREITAKQKPGAEHLLLGYAGTGKTYLMNAIAGYFMAQGRSVAVTAPTHKATAVLGQKVNHDGVMCCTIHSLLSLIPKEDETGTHLERRKMAQDVTVDVVIVDECSMLSRELMAWIRRLLRKSFVIFVGDDAQLPPVGEDASGAFCCKSVSILDEIVRQKEGNPILDAALACRTAQKDKKSDWNYLRPASIEKTGIFRATDTDKWMHKAFTSSEFEKDPNSFRYLAWTNSRVDAVNRKVQRWLFGDISTPFAVGELVISKKRFVRNGIEVQNSEEMKVTDIKASTFTTRWKKYGAAHDMEIPIWDVSTDKGVAIRLVRGMKDYHAALAYVKKNCYDWDRPDGDGAYGHVSSFRDSFGKLASNYAMTVHTSQGSTFRCVFLDAQDILKRQRDNLLESQQLMYVALTRPTDMVFLV